ncbi:S9 family peptidase [Smaragdicoccus niigatensis]
MLSFLAGGAAAAVAGCSGAMTGGRIAGSARPESAQGFHEPVPTSTPAPGSGLSGRFRVNALQRIAYPPLSGRPAPQNGGDLFLPEGMSELPIVVMIHGGGWREPIGLGYMTPLARDLASHGVAVWNIEYRRVGGGGGWPTTLTDVAAAVDFVADLPHTVPAPLKFTGVHVTGHSAGGHLAAWTASRPRLPAGAPGSAPRVKVKTALTMAGVFDLSTTGFGDEWVLPFLGGTEATFPERYRIASPIDLLPTGIRVCCVHGVEDKAVPIEQARRYVAAARRLGDPAELLALPGVGHQEFAVVTSTAWQSARARLLANISR